MLLEGAGVESNILLSEKIFKDSLVANNRIQAFVKYIFELRRIIRITSDAIQKDKLLSLYYRLLEEHGSWIGFETKFEDIPKFPHGIINIFISDRAKIGKNCTIFQNVTIGSNRIEGHVKYDSLIVGDAVYIGAGATLIGNIVVGDNSKIGANANVYKDVEPNSTVVTESKYILKEVCDE